MIDTLSPARQAESSEAFGDVSGIVLAHLLGPVLADLSGVEPGASGERLLVDAATGLARLEAWAVAARARVIGELRTRVRADLQSVGQARHADSHGTAAAASHAFDDERMADRVVAAELVLATGVTNWAADRDLDLADTLARHPNLAARSGTAASTVAGLSWSPGRRPTWRARTPGPSSPAWSGRSATTPATTRCTEPAWSAS